jgi:hypothetical protein
MRENPAINAFKVWIFPSLASAMALLIWNDVNEIKADVKQLMAQSNIDKTRIDNLERQIYKQSTSFPYNIPVTPVVVESVGILPNNQLTLKQKKNEKVFL